MLEFHECDQGWPDKLLSAAADGNAKCVNQINAEFDANKNDEIKAALNEALITASSLGHRSMVENLLIAGAEVNWIERDGYQRAPLLVAASLGFTETVKTLVKRKVNINLSLGPGRNALFLARAGGHYDIVKLLITAGSNVNCVGLNGESLLTLCAREGKTEIIKMLLEYGAELHHVSSLCGNAFTMAGIYGHRETANILAAAGSSVLNFDGLCKETVNILVQASANNWSLSDDNSASQLTAASSQGRTELVKELLQSGAHDHVLSLGIALAQAVKNNHTKTIKVLLSTESNPNITYEDGKTALIESQLRTAQEAFEDRVRILDYTMSDPYGDANRGVQAKHVVKILYAAGARLSDKVYIKYRSILPTLITDDRSPTMDLSCICRRVIRKQVMRPGGGNQNSLVRAVSTLPIPKKLQQYLLFHCLDVSDF